MLTPHKAHKINFRPHIFHIFFYGLPLHGFNLTCQWSPLIMLKLCLCQRFNQKKKQCKKITAVRMFLCRDLLPGYASNI